MPEREPLSQEAFLFLAQQAGLDPGSPHMEELFPYARAVVAGLAELDEIGVEGYEPDMAFRPAPEV